MKRVLLDADGNTLTEYVVDESADQGYIRKFERIQERLDLNKRYQADKVYTARGHDMQRVASIPRVIAHHWMIEDGVNWLALRGDDLNRYLSRKLNDPDWKWLRTSEGRV